MVPQDWRLCSLSVEGCGLPGLFPNFLAACKYCEGRQPGSDSLPLPPGALGGGLGLEVASKGAEGHTRVLGCEKAVGWPRQYCSLPCRFVRADGARGNLAVLTAVPRGASLSALLATPRKWKRSLWKGLTGDRRSLAASDSSAREGSPGRMQEFKRHPWYLHQGRADCRSGVHSSVPLQKTPRFRCNDLFF